jgi:hypothetical protein
VRGDLFSVRGDGRGPEARTIPWVVARNLVVEVELGLRCLVELRGGIMTKMTGRCLCGRIQYAGEAEPIFMRACHCKPCQRYTGTAFVTAVAVPRGSIGISGNLKTYTEPGGTSGQPVHRRFCPNCGSPIIVEVEGSSRTVIMAGTLDDTSFVKPATNIFCGSAQSWVPMSSDTRNYPRYDEWAPGRTEPPVQSS